MTFTKVISKLLRQQNFAVLRKNLDSTTTAFAECHRKLEGCQLSSPPLKTVLDQSNLLLFYIQISDNAVYNNSIFNIGLATKFSTNLEGLLHFSQPYLSIEASLQLPPAILSPTLAIHPNQAASRGQ